MSVLKRNNVRVRGRGRRPMVFSHGFGCDQNMWRLVAPAFEDDFQIVLFDQVVDRYSIADIHLSRLFWRAAASLPIEERDFPSLFAHRDRIMKRDAVRRTIEIEAAIGYELPT